MPPKRKRAAAKNYKNAEVDRKAAKKAKERAEGDYQDGVRKRAKNCNQSYLMGALDAAMTQVHGDSYTTAGLAFVAVNTTKSSEDNQKNSPDPLDLSQKADQVALDDSDDDTTTASPDQRHKLSVVLDDFVDDYVDSSQPQITTKKSSRPRKLVSEFSATAGITDNPLQGISQPRKRAIPDDDPPPLDDFEDDSLDTWGPHQPRHLAIKCPSATGGATSSSRPKHPVDEISSSDEQRTTVTTSTTGMSKDRPLVCPDEASRQKRRVAIKCPAAGGAAISSRPKHPVDKISATDEQRTTVSTPKPGLLKDRPLVCSDEASRQPRRVAIKCPAAGGAAISSRPKHPVAKISTTDEQRTTVSTPKPGLLKDRPLVCSDEASRQPRRVAIECPAAGGAAISSRPKHPVDDISTTDEQHTTVSTPKPGMSKDRPFVCPDEVSLQSDISDIEDGDEDSYRSKYYDLLEKFQKKSEAHKELKKKYERQKISIAEMKDLVVFANTETKKAQSDPNANLTFTTDPKIDMTVQQIEEISAASKNDVAFGQNMALLFYGSQKLQTMSVSGVATHRFKNAIARPGISPNKLTFIYEKAQQRVASRVGAKNLAQITTLAHETLINKGIAEKISNLRKAARYRAARNVIQDADQDASASTRDPVN